MEVKDFTTTIEVDQTPEQVFNAVTNVRGWWSEQIEGGTARLNDEFKYHYQDVHACRVRLEEVVPYEKVVWYIVDNYFKFTKDATEWKDTRVSFVISRKGNKTQLTVTHIGLNEQHECFEICQESWTNYIQNSLRDLITKGKGQPNPKEGEGFNARIVEKWNIK
jgi:hypothetical protein